MAVFHLVPTRRLKCYLLSLLFLLSVSFPIAAEEKPVVAESRPVSSEDFKPPSMQSIIDAFNRSNLNKVNVVVAVEYDDNGYVLSAKLIRPTRSAALNEAIHTWAKALRLKVTGAGLGHIPITIDD